MSEFNEKRINSVLWNELWNLLGIPSGKKEMLWMYRKQ